MSERPNPTPAPPTPNKGRRRHRSRWRERLFEVALGAVGAGVLAWTGLSGLPAWAVVSFSIGVAAAIALVAAAAVGPKSERVPILWATVGVLVTLLASTLFYLAVQVPFVNYVNDKDVTLSPVAGAPPRNGPTAALLPAGEEHSAYCYVNVNGAPWLFFKGNLQDGWALRSAFHLPPEGHHDLPQPC
ncbi:MAG: hypothetical protein WCF33_01205 [Pseudonocardiaceae bacterium]